MTSYLVVFHDGKPLTLANCEPARFARRRNAEATVRWIRAGVVVPVSEPPNLDSLTVAYGGADCPKPSRTMRHVTR